MARNSQNYLTKTDVSCATFRRQLLLATIMATLSGAGFANPTGMQVMSGQAKITRQGDTLTVTNSAHAKLNWRSFSIAPHETTRFVQPNANSAVLNRVTGTDPSAIMGTLQSNGRVFLINPQGVLFGTGAQVNVAGLVASTLDINNSDFQNGRHDFTAGPNAGAVHNQGTITTTSGGSVSLVGTTVANSGIIQAPGGTVYLAAGHEVRLVDSADPDLQVVVSAPSDQAVNLGEVVSGSAGIYGALVKSSGRVSADAAVASGGKVVLRATRGATLAAGSQTTANGTNGGAITVQGGAGDAQVAGVIEARGATGHGGYITVTGQQVGIHAGAQIDASGEQGGGTILIGGGERGADPTIANAQATYLAPNATIRADARTTGAGGQVVLWAQDTTQSHGTISARGGAKSGNGGRVETSARQLTVTQAPDTSAPAGVGGQWLLDPENITIAADNDKNLTVPSPFQPNVDGKSSILNVNTLTKALSNGGEIIIDTTGGGTGTGNILLTATLQIPKPAVGLTLKAHHDIVLNADIQGNPTQPFTLTLVPGQMTDVGSVLLNANLNLGDQGQLVVAGSGRMGMNAAQISAASAVIPALEIIKGTAAITGNLDLGDLTLTTGSLELANDVTLRGTFTWLGGSLTGNGVLTTTGTTNIGAVANYRTVVLTDKTWNNAGTVNLHGTLDLHGSATVNNQMEGQINIDNGNDGQIANITDATNDATPQRFNNAGLVQINSGTLAIDVDGTDTGKYTLSANAILNFRDSTRNFDNGISLSAIKTEAGIFQLTGGTLNLNVAYIQGIGDPSWIMDSGTINDNLGLTFNDNFAWLGGTVTGAGLLTTTGTTSIGNEQNYRTVYLMGKQWQNTGTINLNGTILLEGTVPTNLNNQAGGQINVNTLATTLTTAITTSATAPDKTFTNAGTVRVENGTLAITVDGTDTGNYLIGAHGEVNFRNNTRNFAEGITFAGTDSGAGTFLLADSTLNLDIPYIQDVGDPVWRMDSGTLRDSAGLTLNDSFSWQGGDIIGAGTLTTAGTFNIAKDLQLTHKNWRNSGTTNINGTFSFNGENGVTTFNNTGILQISNGTLVSALFHTNEGTLSIAANATVDTQGNDLTNAAGAIIAGSGMINLGDKTLLNHGTIQPGSEQKVGNLNITGNLQQGTDGIINFALGDAPTFAFGRLSVSGTVELAGTLNVVGTDPYTLAQGNSFKIITVGGGLTGEFNSTNVPMGIGTVNIDYALRQVRLDLGSAITCAADNCWIGGDGDWHDADHWFYGQVPNITDGVLIRDPNGVLTITASAPVTIAGLWLDENLTVTNGINFTVNSLLTMNNVTATLGGPTQVANLVMNGGTLAGSGFLTIGEHFTNIGGTIDRSGGMDITQKGGDLDFSAHQVGALTLRANSGNLTLGAIQAQGNVEAHAKDLATINAALTTGGGNLTIIANAGIIFNAGRIQTGMGSITFSAVDPDATLVTMANSMITTSGAVTYQADNMELHGRVTATNGIINLWTSATRARDINIGADQVDNALNLQIDELQQITTATLQIGRVTDEGTLYLNTALVNTDINATALRLGKQNINLLGDIGTAELAFAHHLDLTAKENIAITNNGIYLGDTALLNVKASGAITTNNPTINLSAANIDMSAGANIGNLGNISATNGDITIKARQEITFVPGEFGITAPNGAVTLTSSDGHIISGAVSAHGDITLSAEHKIDTAGYAIASAQGALRLASNNAIATGELDAATDITLTAGAEIIINGTISAGNSGSGVILLRNNANNDITLAGGSAIQTTANNLLPTDAAIKINAGRDLYIDGMNLLVDGSGGIDLVAANNLHLNNNRAAVMARSIAAPGNINIFAGAMGTNSQRVGDDINVTGAEIAIITAGAINYPANFMLTATQGGIHLVSNDYITAGTMHAVGDIKMDAVAGITLDGPLTLGGILMLRSTGDGDIMLRHHADVQLKNAGPFSLAVTDEEISSAPAISINSGRDIRIEGINFTIDDGSAGIRLSAENDVYLNNEYLATLGNLNISAIAGDIRSNANLTGKTVAMTAAGIIENSGNVIATDGNIVFDAGGKIDTRNVTLNASNGAVRLANSGDDIFSGAISAANAVTLESSGGIWTAATAAAGITGNTITLIAQDMINLGANITANKILARGVGVTLEEHTLLTANGIRDALVIDAGLGDFYNYAGADALSVNNGRWLIYSSSPANDIFTGLASDNVARWHRSYETLPPDQVTDQGNFYVFAVQPTVTINANAVTRSYDGTDQFAELSYSVTGLVDVTNYGDIFIPPDNDNVVSGALAVANATPHIGTYPITQGTLTASADYLLEFIGNTATITPRPLTVTNPAAAHKVYDATTMATISGNLTDVIAGDTVKLLSAGDFADKYVGSNKAITATFTLTGKDADNYTLTPPGALFADIAPALLTVTHSQAVDKIYDATTLATISGNLSGVIPGDSVTLHSVGNFTDKNVGTHKSVITAFAVTGQDAGNYSLIQPNAMFAAITPASLIVAQPQAQNKIYDATTTAIITGHLAGIIADDSVNLLSSGQFVDKNVGSSKAVSMVFSLAGQDAGNYVLTQPADLSAEITPAVLTIANPQVLDKVYDATTTATIRGELTGIISGDSVNLLSAGNFTNKNVGSAKLVSTEFSLAGNDAGNYTLTQAHDLVAAITPALLTVTAQIRNKIYDATTQIAITGDLVGVIPGDSVNLHGAGNFVDQNVGMDKSVIAAFSLTGHDADNYTLTQPDTLVADITPAPLTITNPQALNKVYDATTTASISGELTGVIDGDNVNLRSAGAFRNSNVGNDKPITTAFSLTGHDADNYSLTQVHDLVAAITPAPLTIVNLQALDKIYDATTTATINGDLTGVIPGDTVNLQRAGTFADKNVGSDKAVIGKFSLVGQDAHNYLLTQPFDLVAAITPAPLTLDSQTLNKVYDTTTTATINGALTGVIAGDKVNMYGTGNFTDKNVGNNKTIIAELSLTGKDADNYVLIQPTDLVANITPAPLTVTNPQALDKVYDATTVATINGDLAGVIAGDEVNLLSTGNFADKNVGSGKEVIAAFSLTGQDAINYALTQPLALTAAITPALLTVNSLALSKVYDATTTVMINGELAGILAGDNVNLQGAGNFADKHVGTAKPIIAAFSLAGQDASNYSLPQPTDLVADITPAPLTVTNPQALDKVYDATTVATINGELVGVVVGDTVNLRGEGNFVDPNVGSAKAVNATLTLTGKDARNYSLSQSAALFADITPLTNVTWQGSTGNWSDAVNWEGGVIPETGNVLAVTIPKRGIVTYTTGTTNLESFSNGGSFILAGGKLNITGDFTSAQYTQNAGELTAANFTIAQSFTKTAGNLSIAGQANITQTHGNLNVSELTAATMMLTALDGAIQFTNANVSTLVGIKQQGNGAIVINHQGPLFITGAITANSGALTVDNIGAIETTAPLSAAQEITMTAHSPLTIGANITAGGDINLAAGESSENDILTVSGNIISRQGKILLQAGDDIVVAPSAKLTAAIGQPVLQAHMENPIEDEVKVEEEAEDVAQNVATTVTQAVAEVSSQATTSQILAEVEVEVESVTTGSEPSESIASASQATQENQENQNSKEKEDSEAEKGEKTTAHGQKKKEDSVQKKYCN